MKSITNTNKQFVTHSLRDSNYLNICGANAKRIIRFVRLFSERYLERSNQ